MPILENSINFPMEEEKPSFITAEFLMKESLKTEPFKELEKLEILTINTSITGKSEMVSQLRDN